MRTPALMLTAAIAVAGVGLAAALAAASSGAPAPPPRLQVDSVGCSESAGSPGRVVHGSCTYVLTDGRRYRCPVSFSHHPQTPRRLERAEGCRALKPILIPAWARRVFARLYAVQACLAARGVEARGGPALEALGRRSLPRPIGELSFSNAGSVDFIAFYADAAVERRAEPRLLRNVQRLGGEVEPRGVMTILWAKPPPARLRAGTEACTA